MTRREAIKAAWVKITGEETFADLSIDEKGYSNWTCRRYIPPTKWDLLESKTKKLLNSLFKSDTCGYDMLYRPKELNRLEDNNGWIQVNTEADLPKQDGNYWIMWKGGTEPEIHDYTTDCNPEYWVRRIIQYQPIPVPKPPIY